MSNVRMERAQAEAALDRMLSDYRSTLPFTTRMPIFGSDPLRDVINASPELKSKLVDSVQAGYLTGFKNEAAEPGAYAAHSVTQRKIIVPESALEDKNELIFVLGHENAHALHNKGVNFREGIKREMEGIAASPGQHDYTGTVKKLVDHTIQDEAQAHIGGFNAVVSAMRLDGGQPTPKTLYQFCPGRMRDFIEVHGAHPNCEYQMKPGLTLNKHGFLPPTAENIETMKGYYPEKMPGTFGSNGLLNYRHQAIMDGVTIAHGTETFKLLDATDIKVKEWVDAQDAKFKVAMEEASAEQARTGKLVFVDVDFKDPDRAQIAKDANLEKTEFKIDFTQLGVHSALLDVSKLGQNGNVTVNNVEFSQQGLPNILVNRQTGLDQLKQEAEARQAALAQPTQPQRPQPTDSPDESQSKLYFQAVAGVRGLKLPETQKNEHMFNVSAALALEAHKGGLTSIDKVVNGEKGNVFAVQGDGPSALRAHVNVAEARQQPSEDNLVKLHTSLTQQQQAPQVAAVEQQPSRIVQ